MKFTPGPWEAKYIPSSGLKIIAKVDIGKEDMSNGVLQPIYDLSVKPELRVNDNGSVTMELAYESWRQFPSVDFKAMQEANASLIAAAPDMYEALKTVCGNCWDNDSCPACYVKAAINKAEGVK